MVDQNTPLVSVIMPFLNTEKFIAESIESILQQQYTNWELILIDDGSSDKSTEIAKQYAQRFAPKIKYIEHQNHVNKGASPSRNSGIKQGKGELVAFLDADDIWLETHLKNGVELFSKHPGMAMLCTASKYWNSWRDPLLKDTITAVGVNEDRLYFPPELALSLYPLGNGAAPCPSGIMIKMETLKKLNYFEESFSHKNAAFEDQALLIKVYLEEAVYVSSDCNNLYRLRHGSTMHNIIEQGKLEKDRYFFFQWLDNYLQLKKINIPVIKSKVKKELFNYKYPIISKVLSKVSSTLKR